METFMTQRVVSQAEFKALLQQGKIKFVGQTSSEDQVMPMRNGVPTVSKSILQSQHVTSEEHTVVFRDGAIKPLCEFETTYSEKLQWSTSASLQMLGSYEVRRDMKGPKGTNDKKLWDAIAEDLNSQDPLLFHNFKVDWKNVKDKFNSIKSSYHKKKDYNSRSGNDPRRYSPIEERYGEITQPKEGDPVAERSIGTSTFVRTAPSKELKQLVEEQSPSTSRSASARTPTTPSNQKPVEGGYRFKRKTPHGTGSDQARKKIQLEGQWTDYLVRLEQNFDDKSVYHQKLVEVKEKELEEKTKKNELLEKCLQLKENSKRRKRERFQKRMEIEQRKVDLQTRELELLSRELELKSRELDLKERELDGKGW